MRTNKTYDELVPGETAATTRTVGANDLYIFAHASGNLNPLHLPDYDPNHDGHPEAVVPSMWVGALISSVLGNILPGPGTLYRSQALTFSARARVGDTLTVNVRVKDKGPENTVTLETWVTRSDGKLIAGGEAVVIAPAEKLVFEEHEVPELLVQRHVHFDRLLKAVENVPPAPVSVACPDDPNSMGGVALAVEAGLIDPILVGAKPRIEEAAAAVGVDAGAFEIVDITDEEAAAGYAVQLVEEGRVRAVMKGHLHTDDLLQHVTKRDGGLRTKRRISHAFVMDVPGAETVYLVSDAAINIAPDLTDKVDIVQNAIDLANALGNPQPRVGILSAVETVTPKIQSTIDGAVLSKMNERGQITGGIVDGPLAMDNAIDMNAARTKGITSLVAGRADVLIVPNLEAGNMLAKELTFVAHAESAGIVLGAKVPVILTSRADGPRSRLVSCALAVIYEHWRRTGESLVTQPAD